MLMGRSSRSASAPDTSKIEDNPEANRKLLHSLTTEQVMVYNTCKIKLFSPHYLVGSVFAERDAFARLC